jgi:predicted XRE-type DNA-binding protein
MRNKHVGTSFENFLEEEGIAAQVNAMAVKRVLAWQIEQAMTAQGLNKTEVAKRMRTSRSQLDRLLDPENDKVLLQTIHKAASAIGKRLIVGLEDQPNAA